MRQELKSIARHGLFVATALAFAGPSTTAQEWPSVDEVKQIAEEGYIYGKPIVMNYGVMYAYAVDPNSGQYKAPFNHIKNEARVYTPKDTSIITPNTDTPYSFAWLDLRAEPIVLSVPAVEKDRYFVVRLEDGNTYNYGHIGSRATDNEAGDYMIVGPGWQGEAPQGIKQIYNSTTQFSVAGYRTQLKGPDDMPNVEKVQAGYKVQPLSAYLGTAPPAAAPVVDFPAIDDKTMMTNFWEYLDFSLQFAPADAAAVSAEAENEVRAKLAKIGVGPGKTFDFNDLPDTHRQAAAEGMKAGEAKITEYLTTQQVNINGWNVSDLFGDPAFFNGDWLKRAAGANAGIYGNDSIEATYGLTKHLANGDELPSILPIGKGTWKPPAIQVAG